MDDRILVKMTAENHCILFRTVSPAEKSPHTFYITRDTFAELKDKGEVTKHDCASFAVLRLDDSINTVNIRFTWLSCSGSDQVAGWEQTVKLPYESLHNFIEKSTGESKPSKWAVLSMKSGKLPRMVFCGRENLHAVVGNQTVRRKLVRFLRNNFRWQGADEIRFYNDFMPYSFFFQEFRGSQQGMCGGLILHGQENMDRAYYSIHT